MVSLSEAITKALIGKLRWPQPVGRFLTSQLASNGVQVLEMTLDHVLRIESLPLHHHDPFDRVLIAQSLQAGWPIVTADRLFEPYPLETIW